MYYRILNLLVLPVFVLFIGVPIAGPASAQDAAALWQSENDAAIAAFGQGDYAATESHMKNALKYAETLGQNDTRYAMSMGDLGAIYFWQER